MCPAGFIFGTSADDDPALGPVGPYLQNDYSIIPMQIIPEENKVTRLLTRYEGLISFL